MTRMMNATAECYYNINDKYEDDTMPKSRVGWCI